MIGELNLEHKYKFGAALGIGSANSDARWRGPLNDDEVYYDAGVLREFESTKDRCAGR